MTKLAHFAVFLFLTTYSILSHAATPMVAAGAGHSVALKSDGTVWAWGLNDAGQLGNNSTTNSTTPVQVSGLSGVSFIAAGSSHTYALKSDGTVWAWGLNTSGQLGNLSNANASIPVQVSGLSTVTAIAAGDTHGLALKADGTVWAWGGNVSGQLGNGFITNTNTPVMTGITAVKAIEGGASHSLALKLDGTVWAWGLNSNGQLGNGNTTDALTPVQASGLANITAIAAGGAHSVALKSDGTVSTWGLNTSGQLGNNNSLIVNSSLPVAAFITGVSAIAAGFSHTLALKSDTKVWTWGLNDKGQLGNGTNTTSWLPAESLSIQVGSYVPSAIGAGANHSIVLRTDGAVGTWGLGGVGQLGNGATTDSRSPVQVLGPGGIGLLNLISSSSASLSALTLSSGTLTPSFASGTTAYSASVGNATTSVTITPATSDGTATIKVNGTVVASGSPSGAIALNVGSNTITILVTAQDGLSSKTYTVTVTRSAPGTDASLSALSLSTGTLTPSFAGGTTAYTASVGNTTSSVTVTPTATDSAATIKVNGGTVASGSASGAIALNVGSNTITISVTAQDGITSKTYTVTVTRSAAGSDASLSALALSAGTLAPSFAGGTTAYTASVGNTTASVTVTPTATDSAATIKVNGVTVANGSASGAIALNAGSNIITIAVTAQNGSVAKTYTIIVSRSTPGVSYLDLSKVSQVFSSMPSVIDMKNGDGPHIASQMAATLTKALGVDLSYEDQTSSGAMLFRFNGGKFAFLPLLIQAGDARADGFWYHPSGYGLLDVVSSGMVVTVAPAIVNLGDLAWLFPSATATLDRTGTIVAQAGGVRYVVAPGSLVQTGAPGTPKLSIGNDGAITFTDFSGNSQILHHAFAEPDSLHSSLYALDNAATMSIQLNGSASVTVFGKNYILTPELTMSSVPADRSGQPWWQDSSTYFWLRNQRYSGTVQGFTATPQP